MKLSAGILTYNDSYMTMRCVDSILQFSNGHISDIVVVDDGSPQREHIHTLGNWLTEKNIPFIFHARNEGIPAGWQTLCEAMKGDVFCIFNNDIILQSHETFECAKYFLENNEGIGAVGWNLIQVDPTTGRQTADPSLYDTDSMGNSQKDDNGNPKYVSTFREPGHCAFPAGCSFAIRREAWKDAGGWWRELRSFHEECHMGFKLCELGYLQYMLPYPSVYHTGSLTFRNNPELAVCKFDESIADRKEYIETLSNPKWWDTNVEPNVTKLPHLKHTMDTTGFIWDDHRGADLVHRMDFSRFAFCKYWNVLDGYSDPTHALHMRLVVPQKQPERLRWMNREMRSVVRENGESRYE